MLLCHKTKYFPPLKCNTLDQQLALLCLFSRDNDNLCLKNIRRIEILEEIFKTVEAGIVSLYCKG